MPSVAASKTSPWMATAYQPGFTRLIAPSAAVVEVCAHCSGHPQLLRAKVQCEVKHVVRSGRARGAGVGLDPPGGRMAEGTRPAAARAGRGNGGEPPLVSLSDLRDVVEAF